MSITKLDISLEQYEIGLSGAVPDRRDWSEPAMDRGILEFVSLFSGYGLQIWRSNGARLSPDIHAYILRLAGPATS